MYTPCRRALPCALLLALGTGNAPAARAGETAPALTGKITAAPAPAPALFGGGGQLGPVSGLLPFRANLRLGAMLSPRTGFAGGVDVTIPRISFIPGWTSRLSADAIITAEPGAPFAFTSFYPVTFDQMYSKGIVTGQKVYFGAGFGPYFGTVTRLGAKVFVGANITGGLGAEATLHFAGVPDPLFTIQARIGL